MHHKNIVFGSLHKGIFSVTTAAAPEGRGDIYYDDTTQTLYISDSAGTAWDTFSLTLLSGGLALDDLTDVIISTPAASQVLQYNGTNWANATLTLSLSDLTDVATFSAAKGDLLARNATIFDHFPVGTNGHVLIADSAQTFGMKWATVNNALNFSLANLSDVDSSGWLNTYVLTYNSGTSKWEAQAGGGGGGGADDGGRRLSWMGW